MSLNNTIISVNPITPNDVMKTVASKVKARRLELNLTQKALAQKSGIPLPTYRKFEITGSISFQKLLQIAFALDAMEDFESLFSQKKYQSTEDVLKTHNKRKRASNNG